MHITFEGMFQLGTVHKGLFFVAHTVDACTSCDNEAVWPPAHLRHSSETHVGPPHQGNTRGAAEV